MVESSFVKWVVVELTPAAVTWIWDIAPVSNKELLDIQTFKKCTFTLKRGCDMKRRTHT